MTHELSNDEFATVEWCDYDEAAWAAVRLVLAWLRFDRSYDE